MADKKLPRGKRKDGLIQVTVTDGRNPDGSLHRISFYGTTRKEAEAKRNAFLRARESGLSWKDRDLTVGEWITVWKDSYNPKPDYQSYIEALTGSIGRKKIRSVTEADLIRCINAYSGKSVSAATKYRMIIKQVFSRARKNKVIPDDPSEDLELPEDLTEGTHRALEPWEVKAIVQHWQCHRAGLWAAIMLLTGIRRGELVALDWSAIDLDNRTVTVNKSASFRKGNIAEIRPQTKTAAGMRTVPLTNTLYNILLSIPESQRTGPVCKTVHGNRLTLAGVTSGWKTYRCFRRRCGLSTPCRRASP